HKENFMLVNLLKALLLPFTWRECLHTNAFIQSSGRLLWCFVGPSFLSRNPYLHPINVHHNQTFSTSHHQYPFFSLMKFTALLATLPSLRIPTQRFKHKRQQ